MAVTYEADTKLFVRRQSGGMFSIRDAAECPGRIWWVGSNVTGATDSTGHGQAPNKPFATLDYAFTSGLATADRGDVVYVLPGHAEDFGDGEGVDIDVAGVTVIGLGNGTARPRFDYNHANARFDIGANNVTIRNLTFRPGVTAVLIGVDVEASVTNFRMEGCECLVGEAAGTDEFVVCVDLKSGNDDSAIHSNIFRTDITDLHCTAAVVMTAASKRIAIEDNLFYGNWSTAAIDDGAAITEILVENNTIKVKDGEPGIELHANTTGVIRNNTIASTGLADPDTAIAAADCEWFNNYCATADGGAMALIGAPPSDSVEGVVGMNVDSATTDNLHGKLGTDTELADRSVFDILCGDGPAVYPAAAAPAHDVSVTEVLRDLWDAIRNGTGGTEPPTNCSLIDVILGSASSSRNAVLGTHVARAAGDIIDGSTTGVFTVSTGRVLVTALFGEVSVAAVDAGASTIKFQTNPTVGTTTDICATVDPDADEVGTMYSVDGVPGTALTAGLSGNVQGMSVKGVVVNAGSIEFVSSVDKGTGGAVLALDLWYFPIDDGASVAAA